MPQIHTVRQGETLSEIAFRFGYANAEELYRHPDNADLRNKRPNPNVLHPGDEVVLPDHRMRKESAGAGKKHQFRRGAPQKLLKLKLHDHRQPDKFKNVAYTLQVTSDVGTSELSGKLDGEGVLNQQVHVSAKEGVLKLDFPTQSADADNAWSLRILIDHLDPVEEVTGCQARLANLGYDCGALDGDEGPRTKAALQDFQARHGLDITGEVDDKTLAALVADHGS